MIRQVRLELGLEGEDAPRNLGYLLYSALCDNLPPELGNALHEQRITPVSAYLVREPGGRSVWVVSGFGPLGGAVMEKLEGLPELELVKLGRAVSLQTAAEPACLSEDDFIRRRLVNPPERQQYEMKFISPTSFRSGGEYVNMPTPALIIKSLAQRWEAAAEKFSLNDDDALNGIISHCRITRYKLASCAYPLKGVNIPAFSGSLTFSPRGPDALLRLVALLMDFANYSGIGVKTALGMGGVQIE